MNDFNSKYIKISAEYLEEKLLSVKLKEKSNNILKNSKKKSAIKRLVSSLFKS